MIINSRSLRLRLNEIRLIEVACPSCGQLFNVRVNRWYSTKNRLTSCYLCQTPVIVSHKKIIKDKVLIKRAEY